MPSMLKLFLVLSAVNIYAQQFEGDLCKKSKNGLEFRCKKIQDCPSAFDMIRNDERPKICGYDGFMAIICCKTDRNNTFEDKIKPVKVTTTPSPAVEQNTKNPTQRFQTISEKKCNEYSEYVYQKSTSGTLSFGIEEEDEEGEEDNSPKKPNRKTENTCGIIEEPLIINGVKVQPREFPHQVNVGYRYGNNIKWSCTGSLISENFVLSAAHCARTLYGPPRVAVIGDLDINSKNDNAKPVQINIVQVIEHPLYATDRPYHDIALFRLERNVVFDGYKRPACLNTKSKIIEKQAIASGWGNTESGGQGSSHLLKVRITIIPHDVCGQYWFPGKSLKRGIDDEQMICAGDLRGRNDTCQGDSGGPLQNQLLQPYCMYSIIGVTAFGRSCGIQVPGVYTRVSNYVPWIESIVWPNELA